MCMLQDPFGNESETAQLGDLTIENRIDRISLYGSMTITCDQEGLRYAQELKALFDGVVAKLQSLDLPERIETIKPTLGENPFE